ncbi:hypothetical protein [Cellulomonas edaphi]|uniref:DUF2530 domain-containing protein n=1 Tax=Cellulomonas edaphi TaxID=3053468 RepID=A0ABT7S8J1_9CELL|nr:hypothetical protein [Cellulomons edaphi]MDM7831906.1 hypothetical protein [Cellulomons edaphi]
MIRYSPDVPPTRPQRWVAKHAVGIRWAVAAWVAVLVVLGAVLVRRPSEGDDPVVGWVLIGMALVVAGLWIVLTRDLRRRVDDFDRTH